MCTNQSRVTEFFAILSNCGLPGELSLWPNPRLFWERSIQDIKFQLEGLGAHNLFIHECIGGSSCPLYQEFGSMGDRARDIMGRIKGITFDDLRAREQLGETSGAD